MLCVKLKGCRRGRARDLDGHATRSLIHFSFIVASSLSLLSSHPVSGKCAPFPECRASGRILHICTWVDMLIDLLGIDIDTRWMCL